MPTQLGSAGASSSYNLVDALGGLSFDRPVFVATPPGDTRLFVVERPGRIVVITNLDNPTRTIFLDITSSVYADWDTGKAEGLSSVAFHPNYLNSRFPFFYVTYTMRQVGPDGGENYNRLARFQSSRASPNEALPDTEVPMITQIDHGDGHNFNDVAFGPDGYLYMAAGDEGDGGTGDDFNNAQKIDKNYFSAILRLDVDMKPGNLLPNPHPASNGNYLVPADNPWVGATSFNGKAVDPGNVRTEFYAVGLRNPWRIWFDPETGQLYEADVGQHAREEINLIVKGGNYGWSFKEGTVNGPKGPPPSGVSFIDPIHEYSPGWTTNQGFCVIGGVVYHGQKFPELQGAYVFADYVSGNIWALRWDGSSVTSFQRIASHAGIAGFGTNPQDGELLIVDHDGGKILTLQAPGSSSSGDPPASLADTGAFSDLQNLTPNPGIVPYQVNQPFWSDGAQKQRWFSIPDPSQSISFATNGTWSFPTGTVWIKHFELATGLNDSPRRLETRLLVKTQDGVYGVTYRWGTATNNATLVPAEGLDEPILVNDGGIIRTQVWHYPSRSECLACHTSVAGYSLGFNIPQLNLTVNGPSGPQNQLSVLAAAGYFNARLPDPNGLPALANIGNASISREYRVRSYLFAECAQCHQPGGSAHGTWDARLSTLTSAAGLIDGPLYNNLGDASNRVIKAGAPDQSVLLTRIAQLGPNHMPPIASSLVDTNAVNLVHDWIAYDLPQRQSFQDWQAAYFGSTTNPSADPAADPDGDGASNYLEYLTGTNPLDGSSIWQLAGQRSGQGVQLQFPQLANRGFHIQFSDSLVDPSPWQTLSVDQSAFQFSATNHAAVVVDPAPNSNARFYRVQVREP